MNGKRPRSSASEPFEGRKKGRLYLVVKEKLTNSCNLALKRRKPDKRLLTLISSYSGQNGRFREGRKVGSFLES